MDVDGRSGQNKRLAHKNWKRNCTTCHQHRIKGVHSNSREDGVKLGSKLWLDVYSTNRRVCDHDVCLLLSYGCETFVYTEKKLCLQITHVDI